jgi:hypothetical protein
MAHGRQRSSLSVATGLRRRCSADCQGGVLSPQDLMSRPASGWLTALLKRDVEQLKEAVAAPPSRMRVGSPMGANRALVAKCAPDGFRESLARFRADRPPTQPHVCRTNPEPVFGPRGRLRGSDITPLPVITLLADAVEILNGQPLA